MPLLHNEVNGEEITKFRIKPKKNYLRNKPWQRLKTLIDYSQWNAYNYRENNNFIHHECTSLDSQVLFLVCYERVI